jgi:hypothetical protein
MAILRSLMRKVPDGLRIMSVKDLAGELGEPQTKLYRHVRQLEAVKLIRVAASRIVSGILEQRYQACQGTLALGPGAMGAGGPAADTEVIVGAVLDQFRDRFFAAHRAGQPTAGAVPPGAAGRKAILAVHQARVPEVTAASIRARLESLMDELQAAPDEGEGGVPIDVLIGFYRAAGPGG